MLFHRTNFYIFLLLFIIYSSSINNNVYSSMRIDITQGNSQNLTIAYKNCSSEYSKISNNIINIINNDLINSGVFDIVENNSIQNCDKTVELISSSLLNHEASIVYTVTVKKMDRYNIEVHVDAYDILTRDHIINKSILSNIDNYRKVSHTISNMIYEKLTGNKGYFNTKITYVAKIPDRKSKNKYIRKIALMDYDGYDHMFITNGDNTVATPRISLDQKKIIYVSFDEQFFSKIYLYDVKTKSSYVVNDSIGGVTCAPRFAPNGKKIILSRTLGSVTDLFTFSLNSNYSKKLTMKSSINTSASYSHDNKKIAYVSDRGGSIQIYTMDTNGNNQKRITYSKGNYYSPVFSPRHKFIVFVKTLDKKFYLGVIKEDGTGERLLTSGGIIGSPSWSPNGKSIVFTRRNILSNKKYDKSRIYTIDIDGKNEKEITTPYDAVEVSWS